MLVELPSPHIRQIKAVTSQNGGSPTFLTFSMALQSLALINYSQMGDRLSSLQNFGFKPIMYFSLYMQQPICIPAAINSNKNKNACTKKKKNKNTAGHTTKWSMSVRMFCVHRYKYLANGTETRLFGLSLGYAFLVQKYSLSSTFLGEEMVE